MMMNLSVDTKDINILPINKWILLKTSGRKSSISSNINSCLYLYIYI